MGSAVNRPGPSTRPWGSRWLPGWWHPFLLQTRLELPSTAASRCQLTLCHQPGWQEPPCVHRRAAHCPGLVGGRSGGRALTPVWGGSAGPAGAPGTQAPSTISPPPARSGPLSTVKCQQASLSGPRHGTLAVGRHLPAPTPQWVGVSLVTTHPTPELHRAGGSRGGRPRAEDCFFNKQPSGFSQTPVQTPRARHGQRQPPPAEVKLGSQPGGRRWWQ